MTLRLYSFILLLAFLATFMDKKISGIANAATNVKTQTTIVVEDVQIAVFDRELTKANDYTSLKQNEKPVKLKVDTHQKLHLMFSVKDAKTNELISVHQAFVALVHEKTNREVIFVAEVEANTKNYLFELNMKNAEKDFGGLSGSYQIRMILGDTIVANSINWHLADVIVTVAETKPAEVKKSERVIYDPLPTIEHKFREPEPRPSVLFSDAFTIACLAPFLILFIMWFRIGINIGNIRFSLWALGFHAGMAAIFGLYFVFWVKLDMFVTLKYLAMIGLPTFICGNRLLRSLHESKKAKAE